MVRAFDGQMLGSIELFCKTAQLQSFTAAAAQAGVTQAAVSRAVSRLEARLGVQLFVRSTRSVRLTERGRQYYEHCRQVLAGFQEVERELRGVQADAAGLVRISVPTGYGHFRVLPVLGAFREKYPNVRLEVQMSNHNADLIADGIDLAIRARELPDSGLVVRKLEDSALVIVGAPGYLSQQGVPRSVEDLAHHQCIQFERPRTGQPVPWLLRSNGRPIEVDTSGALCITGDIMGLATAARAGAGLTQVYRYLVEDDLAQGRLVEVLPDLAGASRPFSLIYPSHRHMPHAVRVLVDFLVERLRRGTAPPAT